MRFGFLLLLFSILSGCFGYQLSDELYVCELNSDCGIGYICTVSDGTNYCVDPENPQCGNFATELNEQCDDGNTDTSDSCVDCQNAYCGDGFIWVQNEVCDDAGESATCDSDCTPVECGDGFVNTKAGEECDDQNNNNEDGCLNNCTLATCGDGIVNIEAEDCDDGGETAECDSDCTLPQCGDGLLNQTFGEICDDGNTATTDSCLNDCTAAQCGDGYTWQGQEQCDDGNTDSDDYCSEDCTSITGACGDNIIQPNEICDDGNTLTENQCDYGTLECRQCSTDCQEQLNLIGSFCGDGFVDDWAGETCDQGQLNSDSSPDACRESCRLPFCGDGVVDSGEECDDGNSNGSSNCNPSCILTGIVDNGDGTISNHDLGLMWMKCSQGQTFANDTCEGPAAFFRYCGNSTNECNNGTDYALAASGPAFETCANLDFVNISNWRLPEIEELRSLIYCPVESQCPIPTINSEFFPNTTIASGWGFYWSANSYSTNNSEGVDFNGGYVRNVGKTQNFYVRCVRSLP